MILRVLLWLYKHRWFCALCFLFCLFAALFPLLVTLLVLHEHPAWLAWILPGAVILSIGFCLFVFPELLDFKKIKERVGKSLVSAGKCRRRLVVCDTGLVGMTCSDIDIGDYIYFLAGCSTAVALRKKLRGKYIVVGKLFVSLSWKDRKVYKPFLARSLNILEIDNPEEYERLLNENRRQKGMARVCADLKGMMVPVMKAIIKMMYQDLSPLTY